MYGLYWPLHQHLPKGVRYTTGEQILTELTQSLRSVVRANQVDKSCEQARKRAIAYLADVRASMEIIQALLTLCWQLKWLSHGALALLAARISQISRQTTRWQQWFVAPPVSAPPLSNLKPET
ncbi:four helix bundle protein [Aeromonas veronii]|nr:four helix bundle protein [Aeromonas veronii]